MVSQFRAMPIRWLLPEWILMDPFPRRQGTTVTLGLSRACRLPGGLAVDSAAARVVEVVGTPPVAGVPRVEDRRILVEAVARPVRRAARQA